MAELLPKPFAQCKTAVIPNAKDDQPPEIRAQKTEELSTYFAKLGLSTEIIDLRDFEDPELLKNTLMGFDLLWGNGGNTFVLRAEMHRSGFDRIIGDVLKTGIVYGGESAGAIVAGVTLKGFEVGDDPELANEVFWDGLGLTDKIIAPHMDNPEFTEYVNHIKELYTGDGRVVYLNDNQAFVVNGDSEVVVTQERGTEP